MQQKTVSTITAAIARRAPHPKRKSANPARRTRSLPALAAILIAAGFAHEARTETPESGSSESKIAFNIEAQPLEDALNEFAAQTGYQVLFQSSVVQKQTAPRINGTLTPDAALQTLLANTRLQYRFVNPRTVTISTEAPSTTSLAEGEKSQGVIRLAQSEQSGQILEDQKDYSVAGTAGPEGRKDELKLDEVVVTAQKREERLQDVPIPVSAISAEKLLVDNQVLVRDYFSKIPGVSLSPGGFGDNISIRGIEAFSGPFAGNPTVGIIVDDVPYGSSSSLAGGGAVPDIDPSDLARIEVLRGPQGTLYGASTIGGLIKFVTVDPSTDAVRGRIQVGATSVQNADQGGYNIRASVNLPLTSTLAARVSGVKRRDPGYYENVQTGEDGVNTADVSGGRLSLLWKPSDRFSLKLSALLQDRKRDGADYAQTDLGDLEQDTLDDTGGLDATTHVYTATAQGDFGDVTLVSATGYTVSEADLSRDLSGTNVGDGLEVTDRPKTSRFTQEFRSTMPLGSRLDWLAGVFYSEEKSKWKEYYLSIDRSTGDVQDTLVRAIWPTDYKEYAAFTDFTLKLSEAFDVQIGGRESSNKQSYSEFDDGTWIGPPLFQPLTRTKDSSFTYLVTPRWKITPDLMVYARLASGYRLGGPNGNSQFTSAVTREFGPDETRNYELGVKGNALDGRVSFDASLYYIDWTDIQVPLRSPATDIIAVGLPYTGNAGDAKSQGVELSIEARPVRGLSVSAWTVWNDAKLTEGFPAASVEQGGAYGVAGDRLPNTARFSGNLAMDEQWLLSDRVTGNVGASLSYIGRRKGGFTSTPLRQELPAYAKVDAHAGVAIDKWNVNLFATNLLNRRGALSGNPSAETGQVILIQPRTVGVSLTREFD